MLIILLITTVIAKRWATQTPLLLQQQLPMQFATRLQCNSSEQVRGRPDESSPGCLEHTPQGPAGGTCRQATAPLHCEGSPTGAWQRRCPSGHGCWRGGRTWGVWLPASACMPLVHLCSNQHWFHAAFLEFSHGLKLAELQRCAVQDQHER